MENPNFYLEGVIRDKTEMQDFEGPLSLILMLLSKNKIEIRDIVISDILDQYLAYLDEMQSMDLEIASEFVQMAAHLLYIKTRMLLTQEEEVSELELLLQSLEQLKAKDSFAAIQQVTPDLKKASELGMLYYTKLPEPLPKGSRAYECCRSAGCARRRWPRCVLVCARSSSPQTTSRIWRRSTRPCAQSSVSSPQIMWTRCSTLR